MNTEQVKHEKKKRRSVFSKLDTLIVLVIVLIVIAIAAPFLLHYLRISRGLDVLTEAKTVRLSIMANGYEYFAKNDPVKEPVKKNGLTERAEEEILSLASENGIIQFVDFNVEKMELRELIYVQGKYCAVYNGTGKKSGGWSVYRLNQLIKD